jgi:hypothetical protein
MPPSASFSLSFSAPLRYECRKGGDISEEDEEEEEVDKEEEEDKEAETEFSFFAARLDLMLSRSLENSIPSSRSSEMRKEEEGYFCEQSYVMEETEGGEEEGGTDEEDEEAEEEEAEEDDDFRKALSLMKLSNGREKKASSAIVPIGMESLKYFLFRC